VSYAELQRVITGLKYFPGWSFSLRSGLTMSYGDPRGAWPGPEPVLLPPVTLVVAVATRDTADHVTPVQVSHSFAVPDEDFIERSVAMTWQRWVIERLMDVHRHEAMEAFEVNGKRPFYPGHGPRDSLYQLRERS
jgi:hypothetical protein